jgi:Domain of unknown function (DUF2024)
MKVAVWDTYVLRNDGRQMHFDIIAPAEIEDPQVIYGFGQTFLAGKGEADQPLTAKQCQLCHLEAARPEWEATIAEKGYYIYEMENC